MLLLLVRLMLQKLLREITAPLLPFQCMSKMRTMMPEEALFSKILILWSVQHHHSIRLLSSILSRDLYRKEAKKMEEKKPKKRNCYSAKNLSSTFRKSSGIKKLTEFWDVSEYCPSLPWLRKGQHTDMIMFIGHNTLWSETFDSS